MGEADGGQTHQIVETNRGADQASAQEDVNCKEQRRVLFFDQLLEGKEGEEDSGQDAVVVQGRDAGSYFPACHQREQQDHGQTHRKSAHLLAAYQAQEDINRLGLHLSPQHHQIQKVISYSYLLLNQRP